MALGPPSCCTSACLGAGHQPQKPFARWPQMILMEWTDFWKTSSLKSHPWTGSPKIQFQFKNLGHLSLKFRNCYSTLSCRLILHKIWHCFQAEYVHHADAPSQKMELLCALCRAFITFIFQYYLSSIHAINTEKREHNDRGHLFSPLLFETALPVWGIFCLASSYQSPSFRLVAVNSISIEKTGGVITFLSGQSKLEVEDK